MLTGLFVVGVFLEPDQEFANSKRDESSMKIYWLITGIG